VLRLYSTLLMIVRRYMIMAHKLVGKEGLKVATAPRMATVGAYLLRVEIKSMGRVVVSRIVGRN